jgi:hypothetical protein
LSKKVALVVAELRTWSLAVPHAAANVAGTENVAPAVAAATTVEVGAGNDPPVGGAEQHATNKASKITRRMSDLMVGYTSAPL